MDNEEEYKGYIQVLKEDVTKYTWLIFPLDKLTYCLKLTYDMYGDTAGSIRQLSTRRSRRTRLSSRDSASRALAG